MERKVGFFEVKLRRALLGSHESTGFVKSGGRYLVLLGIGFIYIYPLLYMFINSMMSPTDLADPAVSWIPTQFYWDNYLKAFAALSFWKSLWNSLLVAVVPAVLQTAVTSVVGFSLARFHIPFKNLWIILIVSTFFIPSEITSIPRYVLFYRYGFINTLLPDYLPALLGQGINSAIFILVFIMFFRSYPVAFDEAASLDGAGKFQIYAKIALPMSKPAIMLSLLFSFVWYWNETSQSQMYFGSVFPTLMLQLNSFQAKYSAVMAGSGSGTSPNQAISLAGTLLAVLPMLIFYLVCQKQFITSVERSGVTGE